MTLASPLPLVQQRFHLLASRLAALRCVLCVLVVPSPSVNPSARSESFVLASAQQDRMMKTLAPAVPRVLILGTRWQAQLSVQVAFRQDLLSRRPMPFPIALDRLLCVIPNRHSHCSQALHHASLRSKSSCTHVDVQMGLGPVASQQSLSSCPPCHSKEILALSLTH